MKEKKRGNELTMKELGKVIEEGRDKLLRVAYLITGNREDAEEVIQSSFVKAIESVHAFRRGAEVHTWLYRIVVNAAISLKRHRKVIVEKSRLYENDGKSPFESPEGALLRKEARDLVRKGLDLVPSRHRAVLVLRHYEGLSYEEIASVLGCSVGTVRSRLHHGREKLVKNMRTLGIVK